MKTGGYTQIIDGVGVEVGNGQIVRLACCDCGLVHDVVLVTEDQTQPIGLAMRRNKRSTTLRRRGRGILGILKADGSDDRLEKPAGTPAKAAR